jgi:ribosomal protein L6P/L9E
MLYFLKFNYKMSRIGKQFISIPEGVDIKLTCEKSRVGGQTIFVEGPKGKLSKNFTFIDFLCFRYKLGNRGWKGCFNSTNK